MRHRTQSKAYGHWLKLVKKTNPRTGRKHYSVIADYYGYKSDLYIQTNPAILTAWCEHFDPAGNRGMKGATSWKFSNRSEAEQLITMALLKWGDKYGSTDVS